MTLPSRNLPQNDESQFIPPIFLLLGNTMNSWSNAKIKMPGSNHPANDGLVTFANIIAYTNIAEHLSMTGQSHSNNI